MKNDLNRSDSLKKNTEQRIVYITWQPYCSRSDNTARELGGKSFLIYYEQFGSRYATIVFKYICQTVKTLAVLLRERPDAVFVMSPPLFAAVPVFLYSLLPGKKIVVDAHTGAFIDDMWQKVMFLQRFFCKKAIFTIVTNQELADIVNNWQARAMIVPDIPIQFPPPAPYNFKKGVHQVTLVNSFAIDEPLDEFLAAAEQFPDVQFYVTGKIDAKANRFVTSAADNVHFTGFVPDDQYHGLLKGSDLIAVMTTRDHTMQRGAYEAIYLGRPVLTSDWPILRDNFFQGAVFVDNSIQGIVDGLRKALADLEGLKKEARALRTWKLNNWEKNKQEILSAVCRDK